MATRITLLFSVLLSCTGLSQAQGRYYRTETHCHSNNSGDGFITPEALIQQYKNRFYDIVFLSDHDTLTDIESLNVPGILALNAIELSCGSHFNGFDMKRSVAGCGTGNQSKVDSILAQGALVCVNHPVAPRWRITAEEILSLQGEISFVEIYNPTDIYEAPDDQSLWDSLLTAGRKVWGLASGDVHQFYPLENLWLGWNMIRLDTLSKAAVLDAMLRGDLYASTGVDISDYSVKGDTISVSCSNCNRIIFWGQGHTKLKQANQRSLTYIRQPGDMYVRAELVFDRYNKAWTQPVFFHAVPTGLPQSATIIQDIRINPNPASNTFQIDYILSENQQVSVSVFDLQGRLLIQLPGQERQSGMHRLSIDIPGWAPGAYLVRLEGEKILESRMLIVQ